MLNQESTPDHKNPIVTPSTTPIRIPILRPTPTQVTGPAASSIKLNFPPKSPIDNIPPPIKISFLTKVKKILTSGAVFAGLGSTTLLLDQPLYLAAAMGMTTIISIRNTLNPDKRSNYSSNNSRNGVIGFLLDKKESPGFCVLVQGTVYLATLATSLIPKLIQNPSTTLFLTTFAFSLFAIGQGAAANIANSEYKPASRNKLKIEEFFIKAFKKLPENLKTVLKDPGAMVPVGNTILITQRIIETISKSGIEFFTSKPLLMGGTIIGVAFAIYASYRGLRPLFTSKQTPPNGIAAITNGIGDIALGATLIYTSSIIGGSAGLCLGAATILWGYSNILYGKFINSLKK